MNLFKNGKFPYALHGYHLNGFALFSILLYVTPPPLTMD